MPDRSPALAAAVRAVRGESDIVALMPALDDAGPAWVIACAPETDRVVRAVAALRCGLPSALDPPAGTGAAALRPDDPALHAAVVQTIGTRAGREALRAWSAVAPVAWGAAHAEALITAVHAAMCDASVAAALIGPCDESAGLLSTAWHVSFAIRRWGQSVPDAPTAWAEALSPAERDRLIATALSSPFACASCLPWLPPDVVHAADADVSIDDALAAFAVASPTARAQHAAVLPLLVDRAQPIDLAALTRLACAMPTDEVWNRVQTLIRESPGDAWRVVAVAPWDALPEEVHTAILARAAPSNMISAIRAARGQGDPATTNITYGTAAAFFAALDPAVWDALDATTQQRWRRALWRDDVHLAVRSLGLRPEILARAEIDPPLVRAVWRHACDVPTRRAALFPVALRQLPPADAHALVAAMPTIPSNPGAFFCIAGGRGCADPDVLISARTVLRTPADLACAVALQRSRDASVSIRAHCAALRHALHGRTWNDLVPILALLDDDARAALMPDSAALAGRLALPDHQEALRQTLARLADVPPAVGIPVRVALDAIPATSDTQRHDVADALARALHAAGDVFLSIMDALADDDLRAALLPLPGDAALARALRALAQDDPVTARRLAHALQTHDRRTALLALLTMPPRHAGAVWQALSDDARRAIDAEVAAASPDADLPAVRDPIAALALAAVHAGDDDLRTAGVAALTARPEITRTIWEHLTSTVRQVLGVLPAFADLPLTSNCAVVPCGRRSRRLG